MIKSITFSFKNLHYNNVRCNLSSLRKHFHYSSLYWAESYSKATILPDEVIISKYISQATDLSDINNLKHRIFKGSRNSLQFRKVNELNFDGIFMAMCLSSRNIHVGKKYLNLIQASGKEPNIPTLSSYLKLCFECPNQADISEVEKLCTNLLSRCKYLDCNTLESIIVGLSITSKWKECQNLLSRGKDGDVSAFSLGAIVLAAIANNEPTTALTSAQLAIEYLGNDFVHHNNSVISKWIEKSADDQKFSDTLMYFLSQQDIYLKPPNVESLKVMFEMNKNRKYSGQYTYVQNGRCKNCGEHLKAVSMDADTVSQLRAALFDRVLIGNDVFIGSHPAEVEIFLEFTEKKAPFDIVIDGLNILYADKHSSGVRMKMRRVRHKNAAFSIFSLYFSSEIPSGKLISH